MNNTIRVSSLFTFLFLSASLQSGATPSTAKVVKETLKTYAFSDPDPVPSMIKFYPYCKYDGYMNKGVDVDWQVVILETADREIDRLEYIPFEGQHGSHDIYRDIKLHIAAKAIDEGQWEKAQKYIDAALEWPEHLGVGKPYSSSCQEDGWMQKQLDGHRAGISVEKVFPRLGSLLGQDRKLFN